MKKINVTLTITNQFTLTVVYAKLRLYKSCVKV